jgi:ribosomal protein L40E
VSQSFSVLCLFCHHLNSPDAVDCRHCEEQLNLQPCRRCGAVDLRTATKCYRCGGAFSPTDAQEFDYTVPPWVVEKPSARGVAVSRVGLSHTRRGDSSVQRTAAEPSYSWATSAPPTGGAHGKQVVILTILLLTISTAFAVYVYRGRNVVPAPAQVPDQVISETPGARLPEDSAPSNGATAPVAASKPARPVQMTPASRNGADAEFPPAPRPPPTTVAETATPPERSADDKCPPAVATLGLCDSTPPSEKP